MSFKAIILGAIQGFTEFLPVSSTAHLLLSIKVLKIELTDFIKSFIIIIQFASILAVLVLYWKKIVNNFFVYFKKLFVAFLPTAILGFAFYKVVKNYLQESLLIIAIALFFGGVVMIILENYYKQKKIFKIKKSEKEELEQDPLKDISYRHSFYVGIFQAVAMIPGVSRSAATIFGGLLMGISRQAIVEFSFLLAIPTMTAATGLDIIKTEAVFQKNELVFLGIGFFVSFVVAMASIKFLLKFIKKSDFKPFAWYRISLSLLIFSFLLFF